LAKIEKKNQAMQKQMERLMNKQIIKDPIDDVTKPNRNRNNDLFYDSVITHPPIINLR